MKRLLLPFTLSLSFAILANQQVFAQPSLAENQRSYSKTGEVFNRLEDSVKKQFEEKNLAWPPQSLYIRSFKYDRLLEVWVKSNSDEKYTLFKTYKVCMQSGKTGPKRSQGDNQIPEGFYYINEFNPNSKYHLALGLNYPNASDKILSDSVKPGGAIYIHGNCVSTGCIAISDEPIEELYVIASSVRNNGQDFIPVHVFPVKYNVPKSINYLTETVQSNLIINRFILSLKQAFDFFEVHKKLPLIMVNKNGDYVIN
jgi:murein L,D-transpeptidase YafK